MLPQMFIAQQISTNTDALLGWKPFHKAGIYHCNGHCYFTSQSPGSQLPGPHFTCFLPLWAKLSLRPKSQILYGPDCTSRNLYVDRSLILDAVDRDPEVPLCLQSGM